MEMDDCPWYWRAAWRGAGRPRRAV